MSTVQDTNPYASLGLAIPQAPANTAKNKLGQEEFFKLMTAQLKNQDPTKPMDNAQFLSQIAQFSTVSGIQDLNTAFSQLAGNLSSDQALQGANLVGRGVLVPGSSSNIRTAGTGISGAADLTASTSNLALNIYDAGGQLVRRMDLGPQASGLVSFGWDGVTDSGEAAAPGSYSIQATAQIDGLTQAVDTLVDARVESVTLGKNGQGLSLNLIGLDPVALSTVRQIY
ncbi:MAG: flagellar hook assembly protein FlgD [Gammaproteobacteria bacterium]|nr:flagellar hook assembly protein FlgD [Gammaproteobacteria bacterium]